MVDYREEVRLKLALNGALIGEVTVNMRAVTICREGNDIRTRFVFYYSPSEEEIDAMGCIGTEVLSNFRDESGSEIYEVMPSGRIERQPDEFLVFKRKEETP